MRALVLVLLLAGCYQPETAEQREFRELEEAYRDIKTLCADLAKQHPELKCTEHP